MHDNHFFKPTPLYKEFMILDLIEKDAHITQRQLSLALGASVSMINGYLEEYETKGYIKRKYISSKTVEYYVTKNGIERKKLLNIWYLKSTYDVYASAKDNIILFLDNIIEKGFKRILLYGAGEVAEIMLQTIQNDPAIPLEIVAVIDDDETKTGSRINGKEVISKEELARFNHDAILVSSYTHHDAIYNKLIQLNYNKKNILSFF